MPKLNPNAQKWVDALRSGKYRQGVECLRKPAHERDPEYCCLGVACDVAATEGLDVHPNATDGYNDADSYLPNIVKDWLGLKTVKGNFSEQPHAFSDENSLVELNDIKRFNFNQIADFIEANAEALGVAEKTEVTQ